MKIKEYHKLKNVGDLRAAYNKLKSLLAYYESSYGEIPPAFERELTNITELAKKKGMIFSTPKVCIVTPCWQGDIGTAEKQAAWLSRLNHCFEDHIYLYKSNGEQTPLTTLPNLQTLNIKKDYPAYSEKPHPAGPNICFYHAYRLAESMGYDYFFWLEPDCIPTVGDWMDSFINLTKECPTEPVIGIPGGGGWSSEWKNHFAGNSLYKVFELAKLNWQDFLDNCLDKSFDIWLSIQLGFVRLGPPVLDESEDGIIFGDKKFHYETIRKPTNYLTCGYDHWRPQKFQSIEKTFEQCLSRKYKIYHSIKDPEIYTKIWKKEDTHFSVVIFNYNYSLYLSSCLDSVLYQKYPSDKIEVIFVDDGSSDDSLKIVQNYSDKFDEQGINFKIIELVHGEFCPNYNQQRALKSAFPHISGSYVCFLDSDDTFLPNKLSVLNDFTGPSNRLIQHAAVKIDSDGKKIGDLVNFESNSVDLALYLKSDKFNHYQPTSFLCLQTMYLKTIMSHMSHDKWTNTWLDVRSTRMAPFYGQVISSYQALGEYRLHGSNDSSKVDNMHHRLQEHTFFVQSNIRNYLLKNTECYQYLSIGDKVIQKHRVKDGLNIIHADPSKATELSSYFSFDSLHSTSDIERVISNLFVKQQLFILENGKESNLNDYCMLPSFSNAKNLVATTLYQKLSDPERCPDFKLDLLYIDELTQDLYIRLTGLKKLYGSAAIFTTRKTFMMLCAKFSMSEINLLLGEYLCFLPEHYDWIRFKNIVSSKASKIN
jgi:glycosyltransferase involved in cell wall biosynthesis